MNDPVPQTLGRYQIRRELGRGMMGVVYEALDPALGRRLALKTIRLAFEVPPADRASFEQRFLGEARAAAALQHPGIVVVHDVGRDDASGTLFIALEFLEGRTLAEETAAGKPVEWTRALRLGAQVARALHHAHAEGIVHRDVKPANIMVLASGHAKIMDFGIAKVPASQLTMAGEFFGTPSYMSPEQAGGSPVDPRSDLFSLGCILHQLLTAQRAFDGPTLPTILMRVIHEDPPPPSRLVPGLPAGVDAVVGRALAKDRDRRYPDGKTMAEDIEDVLAGRTPRHTAVGAAVPEGDHTRVSTGKVVPGSGKGRRIVVTMGAAGLLILGLLGALFIPRRGQLLMLALPALAPPPAKLEVDFEHNLKGGTLKVWIDDELVIDEPLESRVTQKILSYRIHKGTLSQSLEVGPGEHLVRVQVEGDGFSASRRIHGTFESREKRRLRVEVGGIIKRDLTLAWGS